jgi:hypothetical protein
MPTIDLRADLHGHAIDYACDQDRRFFAEHPDLDVYERDGIEHELCLPGHPCSTPRRVLVYQYEPGVRARFAVR